MGLTGVLTGRCRVRAVLGAGLHNGPWVAGVARRVWRPWAQSDRQRFAAAAAHDAPLPAVTLQMSGSPLAVDTSGERELRGKRARPSFRDPQPGLWRSSYHRASPER